MEDLKGNNDKKRPREVEVDSDIVPVEPKPTGTNIDLDSDSTISDTSSSISFVNSDPEHNSTESKRPRLNSPESTQSESTNFKADLFEILDDPEAEKDQAMMGLDSVIKSFEEEILFPATAALTPPAAAETASPQPELGYLLEASDDELGLPPPPPETVAGEGRIEAAEFVAAESGGVIGGEDMFELGLGFEDGLSSFGDEFEFGLSGDTNVNGEYVALGGLFDSSEGDLWRTEESMGAV